ncbi:hypothetical protein I308_103192 [Cryptococcus tetragattii IND107]|uniref:Uncharacterized protein n=1 Tax=Cryptococcus tetragattii IND107 TaxID=1296105 RepID=A0ABR3BSF2_9TREE
MISSRNTTLKVYTIGGHRSAVRTRLSRPVTARRRGSSREHTRQQEPQLRLTHGKAAVEYWYKRLEA